MRQPAQPSSSDLVLLGEVIRAVVRRGRLLPPDAEDFSQSVQLRFLETGYDAFARFDGRSSLRTYLTTVVWRLLLDWRTAAYGKWRPSAAARRLGPQAVRLDRLLNRDGLTVDEAIQVAALAPEALPDHVLRLMAERLPRRRRHIRVAVDVLGQPRVRLVARVLLVVDIDADGEPHRHVAGLVTQRQAIREMPAVDAIVAAHAELHARRNGGTGGARPFADQVPAIVGMHQIEVPVAHHWAVDAGYRFSRVEADTPVNAQGATLGFGYRF